MHAIAETNGTDLLTQAMGTHENARSVSAASNITSVQAVILRNLGKMHREFLKTIR